MLQATSHKDIHNSHELGPGNEPQISAVQTPGLQLNESPDKDSVKSTPKNANRVADRTIIYEALSESEALSS